MEKVHQSVLLPDSVVNIPDKKETILQDCTNEKSTDKKKTPILPCPSRGETPISEYTTKHFFTLAFPSLFPYSSGDFFDNRPVTCFSMSEWADHLLWF